ncbi:hypothetical protein NQ314_003392 [Rhamnusium bicolor]|uniref:PHD-type domain-containing protein n=1 Tax=Rhamnusium bicolor TaxID=1586634 RepID=A0AAV8ZM63_9CUCU|nr:hypothetical protein NQ314_003392 [Rhamnusium bicolor]
MEKKVPNYFPRQPQLAHMSNEHSLLHQPTWHTPTTTEAMKIHPHTHMLSEMLKNDPLFPRDCVDLSLARNGNQNGELPPTPISLSVRDTNKINSLPASVLDIQAVELTKCTSPSTKTASPVLKPVSPGLKSVSPGLKCISPGIGTQVLPSATSLEVTKTQKRSNIRVDSILERLNPTPEKIVNVQENKIEQSVDKSVIERPANVEKVEKAEKPPAEKPVSVIVQPTSSYDENSNSSSIVNVPTSTNIREEDTISTYSNEDSLDSNKSRRKRKPSKTIRVSKDDEKLDKATPPPEYFDTIPKESKSEPEPEKDPISIVGKMLEENKIPERRRSSDDLDVIIPAKTRRKTSSESETIDNIAAMVQEGLKAKEINNVEKPKEDKPKPITKPITVSVIKTKDNLTEALADTLSNSSTILVTPAQKKATNTHFVEVENKLEEMFAGIEDSSDPLKTDTLDLDDSKLDDTLLKLDDPIPSTSQESVTVTSTTEVKKKTSPKKNKRRATPVSRRNSEATSLELTPKKKKISKKIKVGSKTKAKTKNKKALGQKPLNTKAEPVKDIYAYDSGSNASSSKSRGPFIQIRGTRDSPLSVSVVNTPVNDEDGEKKTNKAKKFHDDTEYRHKVRSKGLHCSTLSNKYDAQTKDATWICAFCKRGPHASELTGPSSNGEIIPPGDLFGPYFITTQCPEFEKRLDDPYDKQFKSKKISKVMEESTLMKGSGKKSKRKHSESDHITENDQSDIYLGITETSVKTYEIWAHEDCIVWSPGIYLVGPKIVGLEEAVWTSCNVPCKACNLKGANICCLKRGCLNIMHLCCARCNNWQFIESDYKAYCPQHTVP